MIVLDYYDGPLQGFARGAFGADCCYFQILAWSRWRDYRLFSVVAIETETFQGIADALAQADVGRAGAVGPARWAFADRATAARMESLLRRCIEQARAPGFVCLTDGAATAPLACVPTDEDLRRRIGAALSSGRVADLREWRDVVRPPAGR